MTRESDQQKAELKRLFARRLPGKLRQVAGYLERLIAGESLAAFGPQLAMLLEHSTRSCDSFGFPGAARLLQKAEALCLSPDAGLLGDVVRQLQRHAEELDGKPTPETTTVGDSAPPAAALPTLWVDLPGLPDLSRLRAELTLFGYAAHSVGHGTPIAALLALDRLPNDRARLPGDLPIIAVAEADTLPLRLMALRSGASAFISQPVQTADVVEALETVAIASAGEPPRVLVVEDSKSQALHYNKALKEAGCVVAVVNQPLQVMGALIDLRPELILLDMQMPDCSGLELARVLRQMPGFAGLPMLFLSAEENPEKQAAAMAISGDDFLLKPVKAEELRRAVLTRISRSRALERQLARDALTGVMNASGLHQAMEALCAQASRTGDPLCFAMIDIDHLQQLNAARGHAHGDELLRSLAQLLQHRLRKSDVVGRLTGDAFGVLLPGCRMDDARRIVTDLISDFSRLHAPVNGQRISFGAGIAPFAGGPVHLLREAAMDALQLAKQRGPASVHAT